MQAYRPEGLSESEDCSLRWLVKISSWHPSIEEWDFLKRLLPIQEQEQVEDYKFLDDRKRRLLSQLLQRKCISKTLQIAWSQLHIQKTKGKKPWVDTEGRKKDIAPNLNFNVSHEGEYVALAAEPVAICGVDVSAPQQLRSKRRSNLNDLLSSMGSSFTQIEVNAMRKPGSSEEECQSRFRQFWSLKEALSKARGDGLGMEFSRAEFTIMQTPQGWSANVHLDGVRKPRLFDVSCPLNKSLDHFRVVRLMRWAFELQELSGGHWVSVARGPPEDIIDAWGLFRASLHRPSISDEDMKAILDRPSQPFSVLQIADLIPDERVAEYETILERT